MLLSSERLLTALFVLVGALWGGFLGSRQIAGTETVLDRLENVTVDWRFLLRGAQTAPRGVVIASIDDETVRAHGFPLPRSVVSQIVRRLAAHGAQAVAVDILFVDPGSPDADSGLAEALRSTRAVVAAMAVFDGQASGASRARQVQSGQFAGAPVAADVVWPIQVIRDAARSGLVNIATDHGGVPRFVPMISFLGDGVVPSFALAVSSAALNAEPVLDSETLELAGRRIGMDVGYHLPLRYYGPRGSIRYLSAARVLRDETVAGEVRGQVVLVGATAAALGDSFATPFDRVVPGVEIAATAVTNLMRGDGLIRTGLIRRIDAATAVVLPALMIALMAMRRSLLGLALATGAFASWSIAVLALFASGYWLGIAVPLAATLPVMAGYGAARVALDRQVEKRLTRERAELAKFQSPLLLDRILKDPHFLEHPVQQDSAIVFLDLSGFTGLTEALGGQRTRNLLADFQELVEREVTTFGGSVTSFMGDGAMIVFGLPEPRPDDAERALAAVARLHRTVTSWLQTLPFTASTRTSLRIGGNFGPVVLSRLGSATHQHLTATGDVVNVASRLMEVAKGLHASIVVSEELYRAAHRGESPPHAVPAGPPIEVPIRGRVQPLAVRVIPPDPAPDPLSPR